MTTVQLKVQGMKCGGCESNVREAVTACPGVTAVKASHKEGLVDIEYDPDTAVLAEIRKAIVDRGFTVSD
ncbi:MAG: heavy-metal-associated domain-containing protein [Gammaproteobacteria bacterium]|nr:heavy-metal-associated domain-containing protein [Gammaproteobacteria bacterium]